MTVLPKIEQFRDIGGRLPQTGVALTAIVSLVGAVALGSILPKTAFLHATSIPRDLPTVEQHSWAGNLAGPAAAVPSATKGLTSASYTSGFDKSRLAAAPAVTPRSHQVHDPHACPSGLNCAFRTAKAVPPPHPPSVIEPPVAAPSQVQADKTLIPPEDIPPAPHPSGLVTLRLPSAHTLLKPFTFVADTFTGFIKKL